jgi:hypothetical protein
MEERRMTFEAITNYYEKQVFDRLTAKLGKSAGDDPDFLADIACVALNSLPPRYIRHQVDMAFYMSSAEREHMEEVIEKAVLDAIDFVRSRRAEEKA